MTLTLDAPAPELTVIEQRQPDVPLTCTRGGILDDVLPDPCPKRAEWEGLCMGCGRVFRRCQPHYEEDLHDAADWGDGSSHLCAVCGEDFYVAQYVRIGA